MADRYLTQRVYFIQAGSRGLIKIGIAEDPARRLRQMQTGSSEPLILLGHMPGGADREAELQRLLAAHRARGEWFRPVPEVLAWAPGIETEQLCEALGGVSRDEAMRYMLHTMMGLNPFPRNIPAHRSAQ